MTISSRLRSILRKPQGAVCMLSLNVAVLSLSALSGCGILDNLEVVAAGPEKQRQLLAKNVEDYHRALYWGSLDEAATYLSPYAMDTVMQRARATRDRERLVSIQVEDVKMGDSAESSDATVYVNVKYFRNGAYVVESRREKEFWEFNRTGGGWRLEDTETVESGRIAEAGLLR